ncbi:MAG: hypothetical protein WCQ54_10790 [Clostridiaceae bacterium]
MDDNWCALFIATQLDVSPEIAFDLLTRREKPRTNKLITDDDTKDMIALKSQGITYREIGAMYGLTDHAAYRRMKRFKDRRKA